MLANLAAERWRVQYRASTGTWKPTAQHTDTEIVYNKLIALGNAPCPNDVDSIIGNTSWTSIFCNNCEKEVEQACHIGQAKYYDSATATVCGECLIDALVIMKNDSGG